MIVYNSTPLMVLPLLLGVPELLLPVVLAAAVVASDTL
jgi:hypothetical protein